MLNFLEIQVHFVCKFLEISSFLETQKSSVSAWCKVTLILDQCQQKLHLLDNFCVDSGRTETTF
jgi:hypothetical protein